MSHFDTIVAEAGQAEAKAAGFLGGLKTKANGLAAGLWARVPMTVPAKVEASAAAHGSVIGTGLKTVVVLALMWGAYHVGGSETREEFAAYRAADASALAAAKQHEIEATASITAESRKRQDAADARATALQARIESYVADLRSRPADARCSLTDSDVRSLRDGAPRAHRRPAHAAPGPE